MSDDSFHTLSWIAFSFARADTELADIVGTLNDHAGDRVCVLAKQRVQFARRILSRAMMLIDGTLTDAFAAEAEAEEE